MSASTVVGVRVSRRKYVWLSKLVKFYNARERKRKRATRSDIVRMLLELGLPIVCDEFRKKYDDEVPEMPKGSISKLIGWQNKPKLEYPPNPRAD